MIKFAKNVGLTVFAIVFLAVPALLVLSIVFNWGVLLIYLFAALVACEILLFIYAIEALTDNGICI